MVPGTGNGYDRHILLRHDYSIPNDLHKYPDSRGTPMLIPITTDGPVLADIVEPAGCNYNPKRTFCLLQIRS